MELPGDTPEKDYFKVKNDWFDALIKFKLPGVQMQCVLFIIRRTYGWQRKESDIPTGEFAETLGVRPQHICRALNELKKRKIVTITKNGNKRYSTYSFNKYFNTWLPKMVITINGNKLLPKMVTTVTKNGFTPIKDNIKDTRKTKAKPEQTVLPVWLDINVWKEFKKYRQNGKGKFTAYAQELAIKKLARFKADGDDPNEVINNSIENGWSGLFPLKRNHEKEETREECIKRLSQKR
jgi:phage replication O-like protein O